MTMSRASILPTWRSTVRRRWVMDDLEGTLLLKELGADRVVLAREVDLGRGESNHERRQRSRIEVFVHGALCVSYSGNCLMSGPDRIPQRQPRDGAWAPAASRTRLHRAMTSGSVSRHGTSHLLSTKDLNTIDSYGGPEGPSTRLKIEGRMKEPAYVANVVARYRKALDDGAHQRGGQGSSAARRFNRTYTEGLSCLGKTPASITNIQQTEQFRLRDRHGSRGTSTAACTRYALTA